MTATAVPDRSYAALLRVPALGRILLGGTIARTAGAMVPIALVLFTLAHYRSPRLAGLVTFAVMFPGLLVSPVAGALLDRHGRSRLIVLDYVVCALSLSLIGALATFSRLTPALLVAIAAVASVTGILSHTGLRSLFPIIVPRHLWERVNAADSNGYVVAMLLGPAAAGALVQVFGGPAALFTIAGIYAAAAVVLLKVPEPKVPPATRGRLHLDAWDGLRYTWRNPVLRGLGFSISTLNLAHGALTVIVPVLVLGPLARDAKTVGLVFAVQGLAGMLGALAVGRWETEGRERALILWPIVATAATLGLLMLPAGLAVVFVVFAVIGLLNGPLDVAMFTLRQRRTDPAWTGRAFAVSMAFNYAGFPIGSFAGGMLVERSVGLAITFTIVAALLAAGLGALLLPADQPAA